MNFMQFVEEDNSEEANLYIYGDIVDYKWWEEDTSATEIRDKLQASTAKKINVHINSYGGDVFTGIAIYNLLKQHKAEIVVYVDACACSIASVIAMAGDKIIMPANTLMMIHNCWGCVVGNAKELRKTADDMDKIMQASIQSYLAKVKISEEELKELLDAETWLTASEAFELGFCDEVQELKSEQSYQEHALNSLVQKYKAARKISNNKNITVISSNQKLNEKNSKNDVVITSFFNFIGGKNEK